MKLGLAPTTDKIFFILKLHALSEDVLMVAANVGVILFLELLNFET
jgi:hypothetical protein